MTIWKSKDKQPKANKDILSVCFCDGVTYYVNEYKSKGQHLTLHNVVKWCYIDDLLALEEQNERLYQNQMSIVETNNVLIKRLQEQQATIDNLREIIRKKDEALNTLKDDITWLISGGLNSSGGISIEKGQANRMYETAQQALKIGEKE